MTRDEIWDALKQNRKEKFYNDRKRFMDQAKENDDGGWTKHTEFHWSRMVDGHKLDYWPSRKKWQYRGKIKRGDVYAFIKQKESAIFVHKASNVVNQSRKAAKDMEELHEKMITDGFEWDGMDGYYKTMSE